jgi:7-carboxy-7-deazaguanine synthase
MLRLNEIFYSIQGESTFAGFPCIFIRMTGCNLRCTYCDTTYAYEEGDDIPLESILSTVKKFDCSLIEVTGGEPLIQNETPDLISALIKNDYTVLLETNGSQDISTVDTRCTRIVDIKCPSSGMDNKNYWKNLDYITLNDQLKFVIAHRQDYLYAKKVIDSVAIKRRKKLLINFSPVFNKINLKDLAEWILADNLPVRLQIQLHKYIWGEHTKGV